MANLGFEARAICLRSNCFLPGSPGLGTCLSALLSNSPLTKGLLMPEARDGLERADLRYLPCLLLTLWALEWAPHRAPHLGSSVSLALSSSCGFRLCHSQQTLSAQASTLLRALRKRPHASLTAVLGPGHLLCPPAL